MLNAPYAPRQDWVNGYIDLERYRTEVAVGMYMIYAAVP